MRRKQTGGDGDRDVGDLVALLEQCWTLDPAQRFTCSQAILHPFIAGRLKSGVKPQAQDAAGPDGEAAADAAGSGVSLHEAGAG